MNHGQQLIYTSKGHLIDEKRLTVTDPKGQLLPVRPKTCQLLVLLLKNSDKPLSKEQILQQLWADSVVAEQVVFQSINEIRQLFGSKEIIKTVPKEGYLWVPTVGIKERTAASKSKFRHWRYIAALFALSVLLGAFWVNNDSLKQIKVDGSIIILPTVNRIQGNDHSWVRFGVMDQLIQRLPNSETYGVLQTDYVLEVLKRANAQFDQINEEKIKQLFVVSGAELIVSSVLSGSPVDYKLNYKFYSKSSTSQGVIFNSDMQNIIDEFTQLVAAKLGLKQPNSTVEYHADFNNEMMGRAVELRLEKNFQAAQPILQSLVVNEPNNITARRLLSNNYLAMNKRGLSEQQLDLAIPLAEQQNDTNELARLLLSKAYFLKGRGEMPSAESHALKALKIAEDNNDWLYIAYVKTLLARISIEEENFVMAETLYQQAKKHHQVLKCPVGETISLVNLALLAKRQEQQDKFENLLYQAEQVAINRELTRQIKWIEKIK